MTKKPNYKESSLLIIFIALLFISGFILFYSENLNNSYAYKKEWTVLYFIHPKQAANCDFKFENYQGQAVDYHYQVLNQNDKLVEESNLKLESNSSHTVILKQDIPDCRVILKYLEQEKNLHR
ncbi:MAG: hypothetical protein GF332_00855 [Candidatus Moranbacteria bacterium]|nr:hypothetical protein [Candidatus Moranbacteria bacterium]